MMKKQNPKIFPSQKHIELVLNDPQTKPGKELLNTISKTYFDMLSRAPELKNKALLSHLNESILPGAAFYKVLKKKGFPIEEAKAFVNQFYESAMEGRQKQLHLLGRLPFFPWVLKILTPRMMKYQYPAPGWDIEYVEASNKRVALNMHSCFYVDVLNHYDLGELAPLYCDLDNFMNDEMSPYIEWRRTKTIGYGDDCCDFEFLNVRFLEDPE